MISAPLISRPVCDEPWALSSNRYARSTGIGVLWRGARRRKIPFLRAADLIVPGLALGHFVGRLGCFAVGCCFGCCFGGVLGWAGRVGCVEAVAGGGVTGGGGV